MTTITFHPYTFADRVKAVMGFVHIDGIKVGTYHNPAPHKRGRFANLAGATVLHYRARAELVAKLNDPAFVATLAPAGMKAEAVARAELAVARAKANLAIAEADLARVL